MDPSNIWWPSPAKLNLFLHINGRYDNGYHQLQSLFQLLDYGDELAFSVTDTTEITLSPSIDGVPDDDNLIIKAAKLLQRHTGVSKGCQVTLKKVLPMGGGIGGGSSNAATTLVALNHLWECNLSHEALCKLGLSLGADVPIFVNGKSAFAEGVGEVITPVDIPQATYLVVYPQCHVSTAEVFSHPELPRNTPRMTWDEYSFDNTHNDCQKIVCERYPKVANLLHWLLEYAPSRMTGTGACLFAIFDCPEKAQSVYASLPDYATGFIAKGVNYSPLHARLDEIKNTSY